MSTAGGADAPHLPRLAPIEAYGNGGFRFAGMSHRGSILCLPDGIWAWPVSSSNQLNEFALRPVIERAAAIDVFLLGAGGEPWTMPAYLRELLHAAGASIDAMQTGPAVRTYNVLLAENRRVAAGLIAV